MQQEKVQAVIINIGDELLIGQVVNSNAATIGAALNKMGIQVKKIITIGDDKTEILNHFQEEWKDNNIVFVTGGLGTTNDDITKNCICTFFNSKLIENKSVTENIIQFRKNRGVHISDSVLSQALVPDCCKIVQNICGTAPGLLIENGKKLLISTPGVPNELKSMLGEICQFISKKFQMWAKIDKHLKLTNISESDLSDKLQEYEKQLPDYIKLAYLPKMGIINLRLSGYHADKQKLEEEMSQQFLRLYSETKDYVFSLEDIELALLVGIELKSKGYTIATAESCTGGFIAHQITSFSGSSAYFKGSVVAYHNEIKQNILEVDEHVLEEKGAVSEEVVKQMANNIRKKFNVDISLAVSGIAGPSGGTPQKPVGTVWIALSDEKGCETKCFHFGTNREIVIGRTSQMALYMLYQRLKNK